MANRIESHLADLRRCVARMFVPAKARQSRAIRVSRFAVQTLEARTLLAAVYWDGGANNLLWSSPQNWSTDTLPGAADDVTISVPGDIVVEITDNVSVRSLVSTEAINKLSGNLTLSAIR